MQKEAEAAGPSHHLFYDAFRVSPIGTALEDLTGRLLFVNPVLCSMLGFSEEELRSKHCVDFSPPEDAEKDWVLFEQLRAGSIDHYQLDKRYFRRDGSLMWGRLSISLVKDFASPLVLAMVEDITERKRAEEAVHEMNRALEAQTTVLQERQELLKIFVKHVPAGVAMLDREMRYLQVSDRWCTDYGIDSSQVLGKSHYELFPDVPDRWKEMHRRGLAGETVRTDDDRWDRESGTTWLCWEIRPWWSHLDSLPGGILIFAEEITHRKEMEDALSKVSQRLIEAHEEERTRIARELHDDINQRIALLAVSLRNLSQVLPSSAAEAKQDIEHATRQVEDLAIDVQTLSHRLHSSKLEHLGLAQAAASFCIESSDQQKTEIDFHSENIPKDLPKEVSLCLFRILQEAIQNAIKHSGSRHFEVSFRGGLGEIELTVRDSGIGFDPQKAMEGRGLGLISMKERLKLVNGRISINSHLQHGTVIHAQVPLPRMKSAEA